jgi:tRNA threonylcarbamoyl adenosine modification protein YeaZ
VRTLVLETATAACSVALLEDGALLGAAHELVGRGHAEHLLAMVARLPDGGRADHVLVDCGPGSFTGIRVGLAAARALAFGWSASVSGYSSLHLLAAMGFADNPTLATIAVIIEGGHGEVFMQGFAATPFAPLGPFASLRPEAALLALGEGSAIGNAERYLAPLSPQRGWPQTLPCAARALLLQKDDAMLAPSPIYGRAPDAKPMPAATAAIPGQ